MPRLPVPAAVVLSEPSLLLVLRQEMRGMRDAAKNGDGFGSVRRDWVPLLLRKKAAPGVSLFTGKHRARRKPPLEMTDAECDELLALPDPPDRGGDPL